MATEIEELLKKVIGLDSASIGSGTVERSIRRRMVECGISEERIYTEFLKNSSIELQALIDEVTVPETWFFRGVEPFRLLAEHVSVEWLKSNYGQVFRVLSVPCSSGEEPYSIAMVLMDVGFNNKQFHIDAVDISAKVIARAGQGVYGRNSFRGDEGDAVGRYFHVIEGGYKINDLVRESVQFRHGNLLDDNFMTNEYAYDAIFCRNLLIYFDRPTQAKALMKLHGLLNEQGMLFVGHAESGCIDHDFFSLVRRTGTFCYRKVEKLKNKETIKTVHSNNMVGNNVGDDCVYKSDSSLRFRPASVSRQTVMPKVVKIPKVEVVADNEMIAGKDSERLLEAAALLADQGNLTEAARLCDQHLVNDPYSGAAYYLLGVVREAQGDSGSARELFHKTLYLDPKHYQALIHLAGHAERQGDSAAATTYRARARRLSESE